MPTRGRIEIIAGCMFAGKTSRLIARLRDEAEAGRRVLAFKHVKDDRYAEAELATHDRKHFPAVCIRDIDELLARTAEFDVAGLDEAHFFGPRVIAASERLRDAGKTIVLVGLDNDMWGQPIPPLPQLKAVADHVETLHIPCSKCGAPSRFSQRMTPIVDGNIVGGPEAYEVRCPDCFEPLPGPAPVYAEC